MAPHRRSRLALMFAPFAIRSFRLQWTADLATSWAAEMETLILGWYILTQTGSVLLLSVFASLQWIGTLIAPAFGLAGDRFGHRNVLGLMRATYVLLAAAIVFLDVAGALSPASVIAVAAIGGLIRPSDLGMRQVLISETVPHDRMMSAISLARITTDSARAAGALAGAGAVALMGMGAAYVIVVLLYIMSTGLLLRIVEPRASRAGPARSSPWRDLLDGARSVWRAPSQLAVLLLAFLVNFTVFPFTLGLLPYVAREVYGASQIDLGYMTAAAGVGAIAASLLLSRIAGAVRPARTMITFAVLWHVMVIAFGNSASMPVGLVLLTLIGICSGLCMLPMALLLLRGAPAELRGRIMGMRTQAVYGLPLGLLVAGPLIERVGFAAAATLYGAAGLACTLLIAWRWGPHLWIASAAGNVK
jgi:predicted MFS family arabinose efflux permease